MARAKANPAPMSAEPSIRAIVRGRINMGHSWEDTAEAELFRVGNM